MRTMLFPTALLAAILPLSGCATEKAGETTVVTAPESGEVVLEDRLAGEVTVERSETGETWGGLWEVETVVRAIGEDATLGVEYRYEFLDDRGRALKPVDPWNGVVLPRGEPVTLRGGSLASRVDAWRLTIRRDD